MLEAPISIASIISTLSTSGVSFIYPRAGRNVSADIHINAIHIYMNIVPTIC